jgi:hypothetical protein
MFASIRVPVKLRRPTAPKRTAAQEAAIKAENAARIWETARMAEKVRDNYCIPTPDGFEVRYNGKTKRITGDTAANVRRSCPAGVDAADWILYLYVVNE